MIPDLVIGIDSSTTATKVIAWDTCGKNIAEASSPITLNSPGPGYYEQNPQDWWSSAATALKRLLHKVDKERIAALAIANQRETFVALNKEGEPLRPAIIWLDERCKEQVDKFAGIFGEEHIHKITGKPKDYAPVAYRLAWMKEHEGDLFGKVHKFCDVQSAGLGVNALGPVRAYLNLGTAVVSGTFARTYVVDKAFRTMASCSADGYYCETSLRAGTFLIDRFIKQVLGINVSQEQNIYDLLEEEAKQIPPGCKGLVVLPYWNAVMNPY